MLLRILNNFSFYLVLMSCVFFLSKSEASRISEDELEMGKDFVFVRHGHTLWGYEDILKGPQDLSLDTLGKQQADEASRILKERFALKDPVVVTSPLLRAQQTAEPVVRRLRSQSLITEHDFQERYYGDYSNADPKDILSYKPDDAESDEAFQKRVQAVLLRVLEEYASSDHDLIVVSHQKVFQFLASWLACEQLKLDQGGVCRFTFDEKQHSYSLEICK